MNRSEQIGELVSALAKAQGEFGAATKDSDNPYYGSKYADLAAVIGAVRPALSKNGIAMVQFIESDLERQTASVTTALHHGEQFMSITVEAPATGRSGKDKDNPDRPAGVKFDVQTIGACTSYLRRYTLQAICGLASEDDDGNSLQGNNPPIQRKERPQTAVPANGARPAPVEDNGPFLLSADLLQCVVKGVTEKATKTGSPYLAVTFNGRVDGFNHVFLFHQSLKPILQSAVNKPINIRIAPKRAEDGKSIQYFTLEDVLWFDGKDYENGKPKEEEPLLNRQLKASLEAQ